MEDSCGVQKQFSCDRCSYQGKTRTHLTYHKRVHKDKTYQCSQCDFKTQRKYYLINYHNMIHSGERPFVCTHEGCTYSSSRVRNLVLHQLVHSNRKSCRCNLCGKCFRRDLDLNCHIRTHTGEKPYQCFFKDCDYSSVRGSNLKRHMMTHNDGKVYTCSFKECKYSSAIKAYLTKHTKRIHLRNKPQVCQSCEYQSETAADLKRHIVNSHQKFLRASINRPRVNSSSSLKKIKAKTVSNTKLIKSLEVDEDRKISVRTFDQLTRLKADNCSYSKDIPATSTIHLEASPDPIQKTKTKRSNSSTSAEEDPKLRIPAVVVLKRLQVNYDSEDDYISDSLRVEADLAIPTVPDCTESNTDSQTGLTPNKAYLYICKICDYETENVEKYKSHLQSHRKKREFFCSLCDFVCFRKKLLKSHFRSHDNDSSGSDSDCCSDTLSRHARGSIAII